MKNYLFSTFKINMKKIINLKIIKAYNIFLFNKNPQNKKNNKIEKKNSIITIHNS